MPPYPLSVAAYLEKLPNGADTYPDCSVKASVFRSAMDDRPLGPEVALPPAVRTLVEDPPPVSVWVPEVHFNVITLGIREVHFGPRGTDEYLGWVYEQNRKFLSTPLYRAVFLLISPERLLLGMEKRWSSLRRGTAFEHVRRGPTNVDIHVRSPPHLYSRLLVQGMSVVIRAALDCAGAKGTRVEGDICSPKEVVYHVRWG